MATNKKDTKETAVKKETDPVVETVEKVENPNTEGTGEEQSAEDLQKGKLEAPVVVTPTAEQIELGRIAEVVRKAYEGKGTFSEDTPEEFEKTLIGKSDDEIIEAVKPYFIFTDGSQDNIEEDNDTPEDKNAGLDQAKVLVDAIKDVIVGEKTKYKSIADELMKAQDLKEIWRCPEKGYWFSRKDYAENYKRENECSLEHYKK